MRCDCILCRTPPYVAALLLAACAADAPPPELTARFTTRPVHVMASSELPEPCFEAIAGGAAYFAGVGTSIYVTIADPLTTPALNGLAQPGVIAVMPGTLPMSPGKVVHGETRRSLTIGGNIVGSEVVLASCDEHVVTHELGHALGLEHDETYGDLMRSELSLAGWGLTEAQAAWVVD